MIAKLIWPLLVLVLPVVVYFTLMQSGVERMIARNWLFVLWVIGIGGSLTLYFANPTRDVDPRWQCLAGEIAVPLIYVLVLSRLFDTSQRLHPVEQLITAGFFAAFFLGMTILLVMGRPERAGGGSVARSARSIGD